MADVEAARAEGREEGRRHAGAEATAALDAIGAALADRVADRARDLGEAERGATRLVRDVLARLVPSVRRAGIERVADLVRDALPLAIGSPHLRIALAGAAADRHGSALAELAETIDPTITVDVIVDPGLAAGAARVEWRGGHAEMDPAQALERLGAALDHALFGEEADADGRGDEGRP
ncbi:hypothetical protein JQC91_05065 [Jannaschia sp. Os4]|uniref:FliH/SctL family protein n=1 Tax=Jannaschia sp. Os4 TaxID=2807617 RepID=UPI001939D9C0|nr:hypothetical protein [Jannaschia sp. Os4]MBM2575669.1 hypothetical protein [Jannaschia sp. Os4]